MRKQLIWTIFVLLALPATVFAESASGAINPPGWVGFLMVAVALITPAAVRAWMRK